MSKTILIPKANEHFNFESYKNYLKEYKKGSSWKSLQDFKKYINQYVKVKEVK